MRIIAGSFRGKRLLGPKGDSLRPTSDRLRQTLFDILSPRMAGGTFLDVFAGTGAVGIEALSRGARQVVFVDASADAAGIVRANLARCGVRHGFRMIVADAFTALRGLAREQFEADVVFVDPPYAWGPYQDLAGLVFAGGLVAHPGGVAVFEHHHKSVLPEAGTGYRRVRTLRQGEHALSFYEPLDVV